MRAPPWLRSRRRADRSIFRPDAFALHPARRTQDERAIARLIGRLGGECLTHARTHHGDHRRRRDVGFPERQHGYTAWQPARRTARSPCPCRRRRPGSRHRRRERDARVPCPSPNHVRRLPLSWTPSGWKIRPLLPPSPGALASGNVYSFIEEDRFISKTWRGFPRIVAGRRLAVARSSVLSRIIGILRR